MRDASCDALARGDSPEQFLHPVNAIAASDLAPRRLTIASDEGLQALEQLDALIIASVRRPLRKVKLQCLKIKGILNSTRSMRLAGH